MPTSSISRLRGLAALLLGALGAPVLAQAPYPADVVTLVVPFTPGGSNDIFARAIAADLTKRWGQSVVVDNRPGAGGSLGAAHVARAEPNGRTLMLMSSALTINAVVHKDLPFDAVKSFAPVALVGKGPMLLAASTKLGVKSTADVLALARSRPHPLTFASAGSGSITHLATELFASTTGVKMTHIAYKGGNQAVTDVLGGHVDLYMGSVPQVLPLVREGKVVGLGVTSRERSPVAPQIPSLSDVAPGYEVELWWGIFAPAGTPAEIVAKVNRDVNAVITAPAMRDFLAKEAARPSPMSPAQFASFVGAEIEHWKQAAKSARIQPE